MIVRGKGLLLAVEFVADHATKAWLPLEFAATKRLRIHGLNHGVVLYARASAGSRFGQWFMVVPPLTITEAEIDEVLGRTKAVRALCAEVQLAGLLL
jgi:adenosylmethionine-8-amino-7-oxononanoate aminotransferase